MVISVGVPKIEINILRKWQTVTVLIDLNMVDYISTERNSIKLEPVTVPNDLIINQPRTKYGNPFKKISVIRTNPDDYVYLHQNISILLKQWY